MLCNIFRYISLLFCLISGPDDISADHSLYNEHYYSECSIEPEQRHYPLQVLVIGDVGHLKYRKDGVGRCDQVDQSLSEEVTGDYDLSGKTYCISKGCDDRNCKDSKS